MEPISIPDHILPEEPALQRSYGEASVSFKRRGDKTAIDDLYQSGCLKVRFPNAPGVTAIEAVLINTAGGLTGGDMLKTRIDWQTGTCALVTSQAAERIYRSLSGTAEIEAVFSVAKDALGAWLPQETIFFDSAALNRMNRVNIEAGGSFLATESIVFGRTASGERDVSGMFRDGWRIRYDGRMVFADGICLDGAITEMLNRPGIAGGRTAMATVIYVGENAPGLLDNWRMSLSALGSTAACTCIGQVLVARILGENGDRLRRDLAAFLDELLAGLGPHPGLRLPRVWQC